MTYVYIHTYTVRFPLCDKKIYWQENLFRNWGQVVQMFIHLLFYVKASSSIPSYLFPPRRSTLTVCDLLSSQLDSPRHQPIGSIKTTLHTCTCEIYIQRYCTHETSRYTFFTHTMSKMPTGRSRPNTPHIPVFILGWVQNCVITTECTILDNRRYTSKTDNAP